MILDYFKLSDDSRRLLDAISTVTTIQKDALNNDNKEALNRIVTKLLAEIEIALLLDKQQPVKEQTNTSNDRMFPAEQQGTRIAAEKAMDRSTITDRLRTTDQPAKTLAEKSGVDIPAHQPEIDPIGNSHELRNYILCNNNFLINLINNDLINLFYSFVNNNLFKKNFEKFILDSNISTSCYLDFFTSNSELNKNTSVFFNDLKYSNVTDLSFTFLDDFFGLEKSLMGFFYNKKK